MPSRKTVVFHRIMVAVDASHQSEKAVKTAIGLAVQSHAELLVVHAITYPIHSESVERGERLVARAVEAAKNEGLKARGEIAQSKSSVPEEIIRTAAREEADLIVVGTKDVGSLRRLVVGSTSRPLVDKAHCSVMIVR